MRLHVSQRPEWLSPTGVMVNGIPLQSCIEFDEENGWATYFPYDHFGNLVVSVDPETGERDVPLCLIQGVIETTLSDEEREWLENEDLVEASEVLAGGGHEGEGE